MKRVASIFLVLFPGLLNFVVAELEVSWDEDSPSLVKLARPNQEQEDSGQRITVALADHDTLSLTCKVNSATDKVPVKFKSTLSDGTAPQLDHTKEEHQSVSGLHYLRKEARVTKVGANMDDGTIECEYNIPGGEGKSVKATLSVWKLTMTSTEKLCKENVNLELTFTENVRKSTGETNVINEMKKKIEKIVGKPVDIGTNTEFKILLPCMDVKGKDELRSIEKTIKVGQETISDEDFFQVEDGGFPIYGYVLIVIVTIVALVAAVLGYIKRDTFKFSAI